MFVCLSLSLRLVNSKINNWELSWKAWKAKELFLYSNIRTLRATKSSIPLWILKSFLEIWECFHPYTGKFAGICSFGLSFWVENFRLLTFFRLVAYNLIFFVLKEYFWIWVFLLLVVADQAFGETNKNYSKNEFSKIFLAWFGIWK